MLEPGVVVGGVRGTFVAWRWWWQRPAKRAQHRTALKTEMETRLPVDQTDVSYRGEVIIRDLRRQDRYPGLDDVVVRRGTSAWFKAEVKGLYDRGLEIHLGGQRVVIQGDRATQVDESGQLVVVVGRISFDRIDHVDWVGDPEELQFSPKPHIYCWFGWQGRRLYDDIVLYRKAHPSQRGMLVPIQGVRLQRQRLSRREVRRINREHREATADARQQMEDAARAQREPGT